MSVDPLNTFSRAEVAAAAEHWRGVADPRSSSAKALRKAEKAAGREAAALTAEAGDAIVSDELDRRAGAIAATRVLAPARAVQGRGAMPESEHRSYTAADVDGLRARIAADEAASRPQEPQRTTRAAPVHSPEMRRRLGAVL